MSTREPTPPAGDLAAAAALGPVLEAILFASPEPLSLAAMARVVGEDVAPETLQTALELLRQATAEPGRGVMLVEVAGGWQFLTRPEHFAAVQRVARTREAERLGPAAIETLAIVAYKQPVTRAEVDALRGASSGPVLRSLMDRGLVRVSGRAELPGAPFTYGTTREFLRHFGLRSTRDLPDVKEWGRLLVESPQAAPASDVPAAAEAAAGDPGSPAA
jgi:segregation and condensation protein B